MSDLASQYLGYLIESFVGLVIVALVLREVACWYWKINREIAILTEIRDLLSAQQADTSKGPTHTY